MHTTLTANTDWYLYNFRLDLARALRSAGYTVSMLCPDGPYVARLRAEGFDVRLFAAPSAGFSVSGNLRALRDITAAYRTLRPDVVHLFTPVCVLLGSIGAGRAGVAHAVAALTGLGHVFTSTSAKALTLRPALRWLFARQLQRRGTAVVFQNSSDLQELTAAGVVRADQCHLVRGSGVDVERFRPRVGPDVETKANGETRILFASRLLREKGIDELLCAFAQVHDANPATRLWIAGDVYPPNPTSLSAAEAAALGALPGVKLLGHVDDMPALLAQVDVVALPSYREGTPKVLLEGAACGLPIVATDIPGCHGLVEHGASGFLVPVREVAPLVLALEELCGDAGLRQRFGMRGRAIVAEGFSTQRVVDDTLAIYAGLLGPV